LKPKKSFAGNTRVPVRRIYGLTIVWRNPIPPEKRERRVEPVAVDEFGAVYAVHTADRTTAFEVILGGAA